MHSAYDYSTPCRILSRRQNRKNAGLPLDKPEKNAYNKNRKSTSETVCSHINGKRLKEITAAIARGAVISFYDRHEKYCTWFLCMRQGMSEVQTNLTMLRKAYPINTKSGDPMKTGSPLFLLRQQWMLPWGGMGIPASTGTISREEIQSVYANTLRKLFCGIYAAFIQCFLRETLHKACA